MTGLKKINHQTELLDRIKIYPQPTKDYLTIDSREPIGTIRIYNFMGSLVMKQKPASNRVSVAELASGTYILEFAYNGKLERLPIIKK